MNEQSFDRFIREKLENLNPPYDASSWEMLERRLEAQEAGVREVLERLSPPYDASSWRLLLAKMRRRAQRQYWVGLAKAGEAALLLLLLWHVGPDSSSYLRREFRPSLQALPEAGAVADVELPASRPSLSPAAAVSATKAASAPTAPSADVNLLATPLGEARDIVPFLGKEASDSEGEQKARLAEAGVTAAQTSPLDLLPVAVIPPLSLPQAALPSLVGFSLPPLPHSAAQERPYALLWALTGQQYRVAVGSGIRRDYGYGVSMRLERHCRRWTFGTEVEYAELAYAPSVRERIYKGSPQTGYYGARIVGVQADMLALPLFASHRLWQSGPWEGRWVIGIAPHLALTKAFDSDYVYYPPGHLPPTQLDPSNQPDRVGAGKGLLEGGNFSANAYLSADVGLRWEYNAPNGRLGGFIQSLYRRGLSPGIGPQREYLHQWMVQVGLRIGP